MPGPDHGSPERYFAPCGRSLSFPIPPLTVALIADSTATSPGSDCLWCSIAVRKSSSAIPEPTPRSAIVSLYASARTLYQGSRYGPASGRTYASVGWIRASRPCVPMSSAAYATVGVAYQAGPVGGAPCGVNGDGRRGSRSISERSTSQQPGTFLSKTGAVTWTGSPRPTIRRFAAARKAVFTSMPTAKLLTHSSSVSSCGSRNQSYASSSRTSSVSTHMPTWVQRGNHRDAHPAPRAAPGRPGR